MAKMMGPAHKDSAITKASCHCGRKMCSQTRKDLRRAQRRVEAQAVRREVRLELAR